MMIEIQAKESDLKRCLLTRGDHIKKIQKSRKNMKILSDFHIFKLFCRFPFLHDKLTRLVCNRFYEGTKIAYAVF